MRNDPEPPGLEISITSHIDGAVETGPSMGRDLVVSGTVDGNRVLVDSLVVLVKFGTDSVQAPHQVDTFGNVTWKVSRQLTVPGALTLRASATATANAPRSLRAQSDPITITISDDILPHEVTVVSPAAGASFAVQETGTTYIPVTVRAVDHLGVAWVQCKVHDTLAVVLSRDAADPYLWSGLVPVLGLPFPKHSLTARATDYRQNLADSQPVSFTASDPTPPAFQIQTPAEGAALLWKNSSTTVSVSGWARDLQSGVKSVEWSTDGSTWNSIMDLSPAVVDMVPWRVDVPVPNYGHYEILVRFTDGAANPTVGRRSFDAVSSYRPKDVNELLSPRAYLDALLNFMVHHVQDENHAGLDTQDLQNVFFQPFGELSELSEPLSDLGNLPVNQLRVSLEVLRKYLATNPVVLAGLWRCLDESGSTLSDASSHATNGKLQAGAVFAVVGDRKAVRLDGANARVEIQHVPALEVGKDGADFSVAFWLYLNKGFTAGQYPCIMHKGSTAYERTFAMWIRPDSNRIHYRISCGPFNPNDLADVLWNQGGDSTAEVPLNTWTHIAYVKKGSELSLYMDGMLDSSVTLPGPCLSNSGPLRLGSDTWSLAIDGALADVRVYQMALTQETLAAWVAGEIELGKVPAEASYTLRTYTSLLHSLGTSYAELRLIHGGLPEERKKVAQRLGISLNPSWSLQLDQLLPTGSPNEAWLEEVFGFRMTYRTTDDRDSPPPSSQPSLLQWQISHLRADWKIQDHPDPKSGLLPRLIIDPDLIDEKNFQNPVAGNLAYDLWKSRKDWVDGEYNRLKTLRESQAEALDGLNAVVADRLGANTDLVALETQYRAGNDIGSTLETLHLTMDAFLHLVNRRKLAASGIISEREWIDVYYILTQVSKRKKVFEKVDGQLTWLEQELELSQSPEYFLLHTWTGEIAWRGTRLQRKAWQNLLKARVAAEDSLTEGLQSAVRSAEEAALPELRRILLTNLAGIDAANLAGDKLVDRLLVDLKDGGFGQTTRILQATQSLQQIIFALRTLSFDSTHPASKWEIVEEGANDQEREENFDKEWQWLQSYETWRAINYVFLYPENYLLPSLRKNLSTAYADFLDQLRWTPLITPELARQAASSYWGKVNTQLNGLPGGFTLTDRLTKQELATLGKLDQIQCGPELLGAEVFYFVPMQLALQLQKSGQYVAALDWYQRVYAYNLPMAQRKVAFILQRETNAAPILDRNEHWLRTATNPHTIVADRSKRPNPYTRYTLMSLARCLIEFADAEYTRDTGDALANARSLYLTARGLLQVPDLNLIQPTQVDQALLPNPVLEGLRQRAETQLAKLRQGRNIAGTVRQIDLPSSLPTAGPQPAAAFSVPRRTPRPTPYRFSVLVERSKQLVSIAQQIETAYLDTLKQSGADDYGRLKADHDLSLAKVGKELQTLRVTEALRGEELAAGQQFRAEAQIRHYQDLLQRGISQKEKESIEWLENARAWNDWSVVVQSAGTIAGAVSGAVAGYYYGGVAGATVGGGAGAAAGILANLPGAAASMQGVSHSQSLISQSLSMKASFERREQEWRLQKTLAQVDKFLAQGQEAVAEAHTAVVQKEEAIGQTQFDQAQAVKDFLANQFLNKELYEWMSSVLGGVYRFFLQQATAMAKLAELQLTFERQVDPGAIIQGDYWQVSQEGSATTTDRRGLTGSARLLQDIYQLDQIAFESDKRKLNLVQTLSLAQLLSPLEFQRFRKTGVLHFATPMALFDHAFPGHYLRLIKRVRTTVVALIPPNLGIRATLQANARSLVVTGGDRFEEVVIARAPELVALTAPVNATGVFELDVQSEMLLPFESMGVATAWEFQMPKVANPFDFNTIADVLFTIEYTALYDADYRRQVVQRLDTSVTNKYTAGIRDQFPDAWYQLHNPDNPNGPLTATIESTRADFPPNLSDLAITDILLYYSRSEDEEGAPKWEDSKLMTRLSFTYKENGIPTILGGEATPAEGKISTTQGNGAAWLSLIGKTPVGKWTITLPKEAGAYFQAGAIKDIFFIITYSGELPPWPE